MKLVKLLANRNLLNYKRFQYATYYCDKYEKELVEKEIKNKTDNYQKEIIDMLYQLNKKQENIDKKLYEIKLLLDKKLT